LNHFAAERIVEPDLTTVNRQSNHAQMYGRTLPTLQTTPVYIQNVNESGTSLFACHGRESAASDFSATAARHGDGRFTNELLSSCV